MHYVERYLRFEKARFGERLIIENHIDPRAFDVLVPVLSVQPLVENAIAHGIAPKSGPGRVRISAEPVDDGYEIAVADDGVGIPAASRESILEQGHSSGMGVGLNNVHRRLTGLFGPESGLRIESRTGADSGTTVSFLVRDRANERAGA